MKRRTSLLIAAMLGIAMVAGTTAAFAFQADVAAQLRASGSVGERYDGYLGLVGDNAPANLRAQMDQVNIQRRAAYTQLATQRGVTIEEAAAATACQLFASRVAPGQHYLMPDRIWRARNGNEPVPRPSHCG
jgi:uncharacterized protein YdbL (DUF1318 family)